MLILNKGATFHGTRNPFFNLKPGADEAQMLHLVNQGQLEITKAYGCLERKTWKLLDANAQGQPTPVATYMNEAALAKSGHSQRLCPRCARRRGNGILCRGAQWY